MEARAGPTALVHSTSSPRPQGGVVALMPAVQIGGTNLAVVCILCIDTCSLWRRCLYAPQTLRRTF